MRLKKKSEICQVNIKALNDINPESQIKLERVEDAEFDEMWSFVRSKEQQRWLWHAIDHDSGVVLAYVLDVHQDSAFLKLKKILEPFDIANYHTDGLGTYDRHLPKTQHFVSKAGTQRIERKHLTLRTRIKRLVRKTICFSKSILMHDIVIGLFINRYEFCNGII
jgi:insertion element IS1 protein InsB